jgi:hypothetical protein
MLSASLKQFRFWMSGHKQAIFQLSQSKDANSLDGLTRLIKQSLKAWSMHYLFGRARFDAVPSFWDEPPTGCITTCLGYPSSPDHQISSAFFGLHFLRAAT